MFAPNSKFMQLLTRAADLMLLNILFLLTSLPLVTIGPSLAALYGVLFEAAPVKDMGVTRGYFRAFRANFKQALLAWLLLLLILAALGFDLWLFARMNGALRYLAAVFGLLLAVAGLMSGLVFPLVSLFGNSTLGTMKNALALSLGALPRSLMLLIVNWFPLFLFLRYPVIFFNTLFIFLVIYFSGGAYIGSLLLRKVFKPYLPEDDAENETE